MDGPLFDEAPNYRCRVCGFEYADPPWGEDGKSPLWDICVCCEAEFGYEDCTLNAIRTYRQRWLDAGAPLWHKKSKPEDWNLEEQMARIPPAFREGTHPNRKERSLR